MKQAARLLLLPLCATSLLTGQTHRVAQPEAVTRAVAVYEYVGDLARPTAARLIPVSLFYGGHFEDAGTYLARPVPLALQTDTAYELQSSGTRTGILDLAFARNFRQNTADATSAFDEGWFGYGKIQPPRARPAIAAKPQGKSTGHAYEVQDDGKPHFGSRPDTTDKSASRHAADPDPAETERTTRISLPDDNRDPKAPDPDRPHAEAQRHRHRRRPEAEAAEGNLERFADTARPQQRSRPPLTQAQGHRRGGKQRHSP